MPLDVGQSRTAQDPTVEAPGHRQQVVVALRQRRHLAEEAMHRQAGGQERQVERASVVGDDPRQGGELGRDQAQQGRLVRVVGEEQLPHDEVVPLEMAEAGKEHDGAGPGRQARRLGVEVAGARLFRQFNCHTCHEAGPTSRGPSLHEVYGKTVRLRTGARSRTKVFDVDGLDESEAKIRLRATSSG